jgi:hypothetical protein
MLFSLHGLDSPKQAIERLVHAVVAHNFIGRADRLKPAQVALSSASLSVPFRARIVRTAPS